MELAESVVPVGNDWVITLRDARFSDGQPVTTDDVVYTFERAARSQDRRRRRAHPQRLRRRRPRARRGRIDAKHVIVAPVAPARAVHHRPRLRHPGAAARRGDARAPLPRRRRRLRASSSARRRDLASSIANPLLLRRRAARSSALTFKTIRDDNSRLLALVGGSGDLTQNTISPLLVDAVAAQPRLARRDRPLVGATPTSASTATIRS